MLMRRVCPLLLALSFFAAVPARASSTCDPDGVQGSGSIYRICMPAPADYNGILVIWSHGFQDAGTPVSIPEDQLCIGTFCIPEVVNSLGFGFATNSYSKTGLAILQGKADILDLVDIYTAQKGKPSKVYLVGASEGGIITALSVEQHPDVYNAGLAACGPIGNFPGQINYFGDARATFEAFFPGLIPGEPFNPEQALIDVWESYYSAIVEPIVMLPANRSRLTQWVKVAKLPYDAADFDNSIKVSMHDVLRYNILDLKDGAATLGGFPFDNSRRWYTGSDNDLLLNLLVPRASAAPAALTAMRTDYATTGVLQRPLVTLHTLRDQQVPYWHETLYSLKTLASGALLTRHLNIPIDRFEHCNFTSDEVLGAFAVMLFYDNVLQSVSGTASFLNGAPLQAFEAQTAAVGLPTSRAGATLRFNLKR
jgi:pimeloyl-ACP methyl ester carboxylesterase